jgi:hypothetical protein
MYTPLTEPFTLKTAPITIAEPSCPITALFYRSSTPDNELLLSSRSNGIGSRIAIAPKSATSGPLGGTVANTTTDTNTWLHP